MTVIKLGAERNLNRIQIVVEVKRQILRLQPDIHRLELAREPNRVRGIDRDAAEKPALDRHRRLQPASRQKHALVDTKVGDKTMFEFTAA